MPQSVANHSQPESQSMLSTPDSTASAAASLATAPPAPVTSSSSSSSFESTVASAGAHNTYIWTKSHYFHGPLAEQAPTATPSQAWMMRRVAGLVLAALRPGPSRVTAVGVVLLASGAFIANCLILPLQIAALAWVVLQTMLDRRAHPHGRRGVARWPPAVLRVIEVLVGLWQSLVSVLLERVMGMRVHMAGDIVPAELRGEGALVLSNHPSTADWLWIWSWLVRQGDMTRLKIVLKGSLHDIPIVGWALQCCRYLFLARDWKKDEAHMDRIVRHWAGGLSSDRSDGGTPPTPVQLLMFPEGTDLRPQSYDQSVAFVAKSLRNNNGPKLQPLQHLLQTRTTGFVHLINLMRKTGSIKAVYDITIASNPVPVTLDNLARGVVPSDFHVHLRRYDLASLPHSADELAAWIQARWVEKDRLLEEFYSKSEQQRAFPPEATNDSDEPQHQQLEARCERRVQLIHFSLLAGFSLMFLFHAFLLWQAPLFTIGAHVIASAVWMAVTHFCGGFDAIMFDIDSAFEEEQKHRSREPKKHK